MQELFLPGRGARTFWSNPNTTNQSRPFRLQAGERGTIVKLEGCGMIRKLWMTMEEVPENGLYCYHRRDPLYFDECCQVTFRARHAGPATRFVEWYGTDTHRLKAIRNEKSLEEVRALIGSGGGHFEDYVNVEPNDDLYTVAYYYLDRP